MINAAPQRDQPPSARATLLLVGGDETMAKLVGHALHGARMWSLVRRAEATSAAAPLMQPPRLVLLAADAALAAPVATVAELRRQFPHAPLLVLGDISEQEAVRLGEAGARACLGTHGLTPYALQRAIQRALSTKTGEAACTAPQTTGAMPSSSTFGMLLATCSGEIRACNARLAAMLGYPCQANLVGRHLETDLKLQPGLLATWLGEMRPVVAVELRLERYDGSSAYARGDLRVRRDQSGAPQAIELVLSDCSEEHGLRQAMVGASRTEALRALTGGAAHDLNNLLTIIVGNLYLLVESLRDDESQLNKVKAARDAARRGSDLARQLLSFATQKPASPAVTELAPVIRNLELLLARALGQRIELCTEPAADCWPICIDVTLFESAIINLAVNARDAMTSTGRVTVTAMNRIVDRARGAELGVEPGDYVEVAVSDNGPGIPPEIRDQVFMPFFTTKQATGGSGLGLSMVRRLVTDAGGTVELVHPPDGGACFRLFFPRAALDSPRSMEMTQPLSTLPSGTERVLVHCADDDVAATICQLLTVLGYTVELASDPASLRALIRSFAPQLLVWELGPRSAGEPLELVRELELDRGHPKLLLVGDDLTAGRASHPLVMGYLCKPLVLAELAVTVRQALSVRERP